MLPFDMDICKNCPLFPLYHSRVFHGKSNLTSPIMFIGESPTQTASGEGFDDRESKWFLRTLGHAFGITKNQVEETFYFTYATKCTPPEGQKKANIRKCCNRYLYREIEIIKPKLIVLLGRDAINSVFGGNATVGGKRGRMFEGQLGRKLISSGKNAGSEVIEFEKGHGEKYLFLPTYSPSDVNRNMGLLKIFVRDIGTIIRYMEDDLHKVQVPYSIIRTDAGVRKMLRYAEVKKFNWLSNDVETNGNNTMLNKVTLSGFTFMNTNTGEVKTFVLDMKKYRSESAKPHWQKNVILKTIFNNLPYVTTLCGQNFKFDIRSSRKYGFPDRMDKEILDIQLMSYMLDEEKFGGKTQHSLEDLLSYYYPEAVGYKSGKKEKKPKTEAEIEAHFYDHKYCAEDSYWTLKLALIMHTELLKPSNKYVWNLYFRLYPKLIQLTARMENTGICMDVEKLRKLKARYEEQLPKYILKMKRIVYKETGDKKYAKAFNPESPQQLKKLFFDHWQFPILSKTRKGAPQLDQAAIEKYFAAVENGTLKLPEYGRKFLYTLKKFRLKQQRYSTFIEGMFNHLDHQGRIHTNFNLTGTATGRFSSSNPNLQNIPRDSTDNEIKRLFVVSSPDRSFVEIDFSQLELRILAHLSQDRGLILAYKNKRDIHLQTAVKVNAILHPHEAVSYKVAAEEYKVSEESWSTNRTKAKGVNFGIPYGITAVGLAAQVKIAIEEAQKFIEGFMEAYPGVGEYQRKTVAYCEKKGYVCTLFGRRRHLPNINDKNKYFKKRVERQAQNARIQGTAGDITEFAMIYTDERLYQTKLNWDMLIQVHDSILFEVDDSCLTEFTVKLRSLLDNLPLQEALGAKLCIPLPHDMKVGKCWGDMTKNIRKYAEDLCRKKEQRERFQKLLES